MSETSTQAIWITGVGTALSPFQLVHPREGAPTPISSTLVGVIAASEALAVPIRLAQGGFILRLNTTRWSERDRIRRINESLQRYGTLE